jgi:acetylglutamate kinase
LKIFKIGGSIVDDKTALHRFLGLLSTIKEPKILIHGGGKIASELSKQLQLEVKMIDGRRITDAETLKVTVMTYAGWINKNIVAQLNALNVGCVGLTGADGNLIQAHKRKHPTIDFGFVGDIDVVNIEWVNQLLALHLLPVIAPITHDGKGQLLNTNADTIATAIAAALAQKEDVELYYLFDLPGLLQNINQPDSIITSIKIKDIDVLESSNVISGGMIPKIHNARLAVEKGVKKITFTNLEGLNEILNGKTSGTQIIL